MKQNNEHITHKDKILGGYCWECKKRTQSNIPGWKRPLRGPSTHYNIWSRNDEDGRGYTTEVVWANGNIDNKRNQGECGLCGLYCAYPVSKDVTENGDTYREIKINQVKHS